MSPHRWGCYAIIPFCNSLWGSIRRPLPYTELSICHKRIHQGSIVTASQLQKASADLFSEQTPAFYFFHPL